MKSIIPCKLCDKEILTESRWCAFCKNYSFVLDIHWQLESELIRAANYNLVFFPAYKEANIVEAGDSWKKIHTIPMEELTPELAKYWQTKLKKYVIFQ